ncbi:hypothetical protein SNE40_000806 [Patella caerulea]|uniref:Uncharacterized protein n=2 Tax=Patella caerulea TaxID=87958 RepID=A0AAN8Q251_PATCE
MDVLTLKIFITLVAFYCVNGACPPNPKVKAAECGQVFTQFGKTQSDQRQAMCPAVYNAVYCLVNLMKECKEFQNSADPESFKKKILPSIDHVCAPGIIEESVNPCNRSGFAQMINQCSDLALEEYNVRGEVCRYVISKGNCIENVLNHCRNVLADNMSEMAEYEDYIGRYRDACKNGETPKITFENNYVNPPDGYVNDNAGNTPVITEPDGVDFMECSELAQKCVNMSIENTKPECPVMKATFECMDEVMTRCNSLLPDSFRMKIEQSRREYHTQCENNNGVVGVTESGMAGNNNGMGETVSGEEEFDITKFKPKGEITVVECNHLIKLCSDMIVNIYRPEEEQCRKNERIRHCLMSTIHMCLFVLQPELIADLRQSVDLYKTCKIDPCPNPDRDFEQCEDIMDGVKPHGICKAGYITLECYKVYMARCEDKMTSYMKGGVRDFKAFIKRRCGY